MLARPLRSRIAKSSKPLGEELRSATPCGPLLRQIRQQRKATLRSRILRGTGSLQGLISNWRTSYSDRNTKRSRNRIFVSSAFISSKGHWPQLINYPHRRRYLGCGSRSTRRAYRLGSTTPHLQTSRRAGRSCPSQRHLRCELPTLRLCIPVGAHQASRAGGLSLYERFGFELHGEPQRPTSDPDIVVRSSLFLVIQRPCSQLTRPPTALPAASRTHRARLRHSR